ncbi:MAG: hypothetical protein HDS66_07610 [Bacteroidales bacterium]|nr:hypothetical protein [Bacteroidales bacterium]
MKKIFLSALMIMCAIFVASAKDTYSRDVKTLPVAAQTVLSSNFKSDVSVIKLDKDFGRVSEYEVILTDGTEVTFDRAGNWKEVETRAGSSVPSKLVPAAISKYVSANQKGAKIVGIEKDRKGYEVTLSNGVEMKFNSAGQFIKYDK